MTDADLAKAKGGKILHFPTVAGADVLAYNVPGNPQLKLDADSVAGIFLGKITKWNDPALVALNPDAKLPDADIVVGHRTDASGTTFVFTDYLSHISSEWKTKVGASKDPGTKWPTGQGGKGNDGVAGLIKNTPGAIGYVELTYAVQNKMPFADLKNADGNFVTASLDSVSEALNGAKIPDDFRFSMINAPGAKSYPIASCTWLLVYQQQKDAAKGKALVDFLKWAYGPGEDEAKDLDYARLPSSLVDRVTKAIDTIKY
jgi:phosphate transport system substrate-binding protein